MQFSQATVTKLDNGFVVALQGFDILTKQPVGEQYIAEDLSSACEIILKGGIPTKLASVGAIKKG